MGKLLSHTPGPWSIIERQDGSFLVKAGSWDIAHNQHSGVHPERERANAHLIAAAPYLLAELLEAITIIGNYAKHDRRAGEHEDADFAEQKIVQFRNTIAKAEGL